MILIKQQEIAMNRRLIYTLAILFAFLSLGGAVASAIFTPRADSISDAIGQVKPSAQDPLARGELDIVLAAYRDQTQQLQRARLLGMTFGVFMCGNFSAMLAISIISRPRLATK